MMTSYTHQPVALQRTLEILSPVLNEPGALAVDATCGLGGHTEALLDTFPGLEVLGIDRDPRALDMSRERLARFGQRVTLVHARYDRIAEVVADHFPGRAPQAILFDLGVSSMQLDDASRGFSYLSQHHLDMRMNPQDDLTAADILRDWSEPELASLFRRYGDEPLAGRYARAIVQAREEAPLERADQLVALLDRVTPRRQATRGHVAKRVFQALRIEVNRELESLELALPRALDVLAPGGRIVVLSYQSAEDRLVKHAINQRTKSQTPIEVPVELARDRATFRWVVKLEGPSEDEVAANPRAASVRLRAAEKEGTLS